MWWERIRVVLALIVLSVLVFLRALNALTRTSVLTETDAAKVWPMLLIGVKKINNCSDNREINAYTNFSQQHRKFKVSIISNAPAYGKFGQLVTRDIPISEMPTVQVTHNSATHFSTKPTVSSIQTPQLIRHSTI